MPPRYLNCFCACLLCFPWFTPLVSVLIPSSSFSLFSTNLTNPDSVYHRMIVFSIFQKKKTLFNFYQKAFFDLYYVSYVFNKLTKIKWQTSDGLLYKWTAFCEGQEKGGYWNCLQMRLRVPFLLPCRFSDNHRRHRENRPEVPWHFHPRKK